MTVELDGYTQALEDAGEALEDLDHEIDHLRIRKISGDAETYTEDVGNAAEIVTEMEETIEDHLAAGMDVQSAYTSHPDDKISVNYSEDDDAYRVQAIRSGLDREEAEVRRAMEDQGLELLG